MGNLGSVNTGDGSHQGQKPQMSEAEKQEATFREAINELKHVRAQVVYTQFNKNKQFAFKNQQVANSPYHLVKNYPEQIIIKQSDHENLYKRNVDCPGVNIDFSLQVDRGDFVKNCAPPTAGVGHFELPEDYDASTYLTQVRRVPNRLFDTYGKRDTEKGIIQGGDPLQTDVLDPRARSQHFYDINNKEKHCMNRLDKGTLAFDKYV